MNVAEIEITKHRASWCNTIGNAVITTGFLAPVAASLIGLTAPGQDLGLMLITNIAALVLGISLHRYGQSFLSEIDR